MITKIGSGQNTYDLALQIYGNVDGDSIRKVLENSPIINATAATKINTVVTHEEVKNSVTLFYKKQSIRPANSIFTTDEINGGFSGDYTGPGYTKDYIIEQ